jgi:outer membrane protein W
MKNYKKSLSAVLLVILISSISFAQRNSSSGNCVQKGTILIDAFYGLPYFNGALIKAAYSADSLGATAHNYNQFGAKVEYMVSDKIGVGLEGTYALATVDYRGNNLHYYTAGMSKVRVLAKVNYHFATSEHIDPYLTWGAGYKNTNIYTNEPADVKKVSVNLVPVAFRVGIGMRYFFNDIVGVNAEVGLGGPMVQAGVSFKL